MTQRPRTRILCVDDQEDFHELLTIGLSSYSITSAASLSAGLELAGTEFFDLYILDNWLPDSSGVELCRQIRAFDHNTPIVFVSAAAYAADHQQALDSGANAYINKPVDLMSLQTTIEKLVRASEAKALEAKIDEIAALREAIRELSTSRELPPQAACI